MGLAGLGECIVEESGGRVGGGLSYLYEAIVPRGANRTRESNGYPIVLNVIEMRRKMSYSRYRGRVLTRRPSVYMLWSCYLRCGVHIRMVPLREHDPFLRTRGMTHPSGITPPIPSPDPFGSCISSPTSKALDAGRFESGARTIGTRSSRCTPVDGPGRVWTTQGPAREREV